MQNPFGYQLVAPLRYKYIYIYIYNATECAGMLFGGLVLQLLGQDYSKQDAQDEVFRLKVRRMKSDRRRGSMYTLHMKVREKLVRWILQKMFRKPFDSVRLAW